MPSLFSSPGPQTLDPRPFFLLLILLLTALPLHAQAQPNPDLAKEVQLKLKSKQFADALTQSQKLLDSPNLTPADKAKYLSLAAHAAYAQNTPESQRLAQEYQQKLLADPAIPNPLKVQAIKSFSELYIASLAGQDLSLMNLAPAEAILLQAQSLPNLKPDEQAAAHTNLADLYARQDKHTLARQQYEKALPLTTVDKNKPALQKRIADMLVREDKRDQALAIYTSLNLDLLSFHAAYGPADKLLEECLKTLADPSATDTAKWAAFRAHPAFNWQALDVNTIHQLGEKYLTDSLNQTPSRILPLLGPFKKARPDSNAPFILWAAPYLLQCKLSPADYTLIQTARLDATAISGKPLTDLAASLAADPKLTPQARAHADLVATTLPSPTPANIAAALARHKDLPSADKAQALLSAAKTALRVAGHPSAQTAAQALHQAYLTLLAQAPQASILCPFSPDAPADLGAWLAHEASEQSPARATTPLDRPYGDNLKFLIETDSAMTGRQSDTQAQSADDSKTQIQFFADAHGIHLFIRAHDAKLPEALAGTARAGGFEMYLAPGPAQPYYTLLGNLPNPDFKPTLFLTSYPNPSFRTLSEKDGTFSSQTRPIPGAFASHLFFSWLTFYDKLPSQNTPWQFEAIRWTRQGGFSFAGSKSVHNRSSWGNLTFTNLTPENLLSIKRNIIYQALPRYRKAKDISSPVGHWADPVLGDPAFYNAHVKPLLTQLDQYVPRVTKDMTPADIDDLYQNAVPGWMELTHTVANLRRQYLQTQLLTTN